jgi:hypothetical protein
MKQTTLPLLAVLLLALGACAGDGARQARGNADELGPVTADFTASPDTIEVRVRDRQPVDRVELAGPAGEIVIAWRLERERVAAGAAPSPKFGLGVGIFGGSSTRVGTSVGIGFPLGGVENAPDEPYVISIALVRLPDLAAYRATWRQWSVRIRLGDADSNYRFMQIPAPAPRD